MNSNADRCDNLASLAARRGGSSLPILNLLVRLLFCSDAATPHYLSGQEGKGQG